MGRGVGVFVGVAVKVGGSVAVAVGSSGEVVTAIVAMSVASIGGVPSPPSEQDVNRVISTISISTTM